MREFLVLLAVSLAGLAIAGDRRFRVGAMVAAPIIGTATYLLAGAILVGLEAFTVGRALGVVGTLAVVTAWVVHHRSPGTVAWRSLARATTFVTMGVGAVVAATYAVPITALTPDSGEYLVVAGMLGETGSVAAASPTFLLMRQLGVGLIHVIGFDGPGRAVAWTPLLTASAVVTTLQVAWTRLRPRTASAAALAGLLAAPLLLLVTADRTLFHATYVNGHMLFAALLLVGMARPWDAATGGERWGILAAGLCFGSLLTIRAEAAIVVAIFLLPVILSPAWDLRERLALVSPLLVAAGSWWWLSVRPRVEPGDLGLSGPVDPVFVVVVGIAFVATVATWLPPAPLRRVAVASMGTVLAGYLLWKLAMLPDEMAATLAATATNLTTAGLWGLTWPILAVLVAGVFVSRAVPDDTVFAAGLSLYALALVAFAFLREIPYRVGSGDSGNRMIVHVAFVALLYVMLGVGRAAERSERAPIEPA